ncbi:MAG: class I SAM-dependent methyltransferase [Deltaproteobacteria bacterium]
MQNPWESVPVAAFFRCPGCGGAEIEVLPASWQCLGCGHIYPVEQEIPILHCAWPAHQQKIARAQAANPGWYEELQPAEAVSPWRHHLKKRRLYVESAISGHLQARGQTRAAALLDLGCGDGNHLRYLQKYARMSYGSDYNLARLARARRRCPEVPLYLADILNYPVQDDFFDIIFCNHVVEHIPEDHLALQTMHRILKPGGLLVLGVPNEGAWWWQLAYRLQPGTLRTTDHVQFYTAAGIGRKLEDQEFKLLETVHLGWGPPHWGLDQALRQFKVLDDFFEICGKRLVPQQASSLYLLATKG